MKNLVMKKQVCICLLGIMVVFLSGCMNLEGAKGDPTAQWTVGWNLGNTLDSIDFKRDGSVEYYETLWGNSVTTEQMIETVKNAGFDAIRVPVSWYDHVDENGIIDSEWMNRVEEVVQYVINNDLTCIINLHHDTGKVAWINADIEKKEEKKEIIRSLWNQISLHFQSYDEKLIFENMNEILNDEGQWTEIPNEDLEMVNELNQVFVDTVRQGGGYNKTRFLIVNTYGALTEQEVLDVFSMPKDTVKNCLIAGVHYYALDEESIDAMIERLETTFVQNKIPVIIGECGMENKNEEGIREKRLNYAEYLITKAREKGITCFWWDNGGKFKNGDEVTNYALLNRESCEWYDQELVNLIVKSGKN